MVEKLWHCFCCFKCNSSFATIHMKGRSKKSFKCRRRSKYCNRTPSQFHPLSKHPNYHYRAHMHTRRHTHIILTCDRTARVPGHLEKRTNKQENTNDIFAGLSRDYPGIVPGLSRHFPEISSEFCLYVSLFAPKSFFPRSKVLKEAAEKKRKKQP